MIGVLGILLCIVFILITLTSSRDNSYHIDEVAQRQEIVSPQHIVAECCVVEVNGAVLHPGVYQLPEQSRVQDAVLAAGGFSNELDTERLSTEVQLAKKIDDGEKITIPLRSTALEVGVKTVSSDLVSINRATESELDTLPGVGEKTVQKIIEQRPYASVEDFFTKLKFSENQQEKLRELISE